VEDSSLPSSYTVLPNSKDHNALPTSTLLHVTLQLRAPLVILRSLSETLLVFARAALGEVLLGHSLHVGPLALHYVNDTIPRRRRCSGCGSRSGRASSTASGGGAHVRSLVGHGRGTGLGSRFAGSGGVDDACVLSVHSESDLHEVLVAALSRLGLVHGCDAEELAHGGLLHHNGLAHSPSTGRGEPDAEASWLPAGDEEDDTGHTPEHEASHAGVHHRIVLAALAAVAEHDVHGAGHDGGQEQVSISDGQISDPAEAAVLQAGHGQVGHSTHELEGAVTDDGLHNHGRKLFGVAHASAFADGVHFAPGSHDTGLVACFLCGGHALANGPGDGHKSRLAGGLVGGLQVQGERDNTHEDGGRGDRSPPGQTSSNVNVLQCPLDDRSRAKAIVETDLLQESESFRDARDHIVGGGDLDIVEGDCVEVVRGGSRVGRSRGGGLSERRLGC
jgi:hypothetical protein